MVFKSENTKMKFEVESKEEYNTQLICYFNKCRNLSLHGIFSKKLGLTSYLSPKQLKKN